jgi:endonuclease/exonuclease/phosphatase family metal-dependent hydrolase
LKPIRWIFRWGNLAVILITLIAYIVPYYHPRDSGYFYYIGLFFPILFWLNIFFIFYWWRLKERFALFSLLTLAIGYSHVHSQFGLHFLSSADAKSISIMTFNVGGLPKTFPQSRNRALGFSEASIFFEDEKPDILCLQESAECRYIYDNNPLTNINALNRLPYRAYSNSKEVGIFSRYPITHFESIDIGYPYNTCCFADLNVNGKMLRVYTAHLQSNNITDRSSKLLQKGDYTEKENIQKGKGILRLVRKSAFVRGDQAEIIKKHALQSPYPVIICGDFNDPPQSYCYHTLADGLQDAFKEAGRGLGTTFAGSIPLLHIDHILLNPKFEVDQCRIIDSGFSDHYAVRTFFHF